MFISIALFSKELLVESVGIIFNSEIINDLLYPDDNGSPISCVVIDKVPFRINCRGDYGITTDIKVQ